MSSYIYSCKAHGYSSIHVFTRHILSHEKEEKHPRTGMTSTCLRTIKRKRKRQAISGLEQIASTAHAISPRKPRFHKGGKTAGELPMDQGSNHKVP
jgi:hypothetical protein